MSDELRHLEISTPTRTHVPELEQFAINQKPKSSDHRDLRLYRYGVSSLYQWWSKQDGSVFEDPCDEPFIITVRAQGPGPGEAVEAIIARVSDEDLRALASTYDTGKCRAVLRTVLRDALAATPTREG